jgi:hypothetical protein
VNDESNLYMNIGKDKITHSITSPKHECWLKVNDSFRVACKTYPNKFHRFFIKLIFGWEYEKI